ncbi:MAG: leucine-rich repeat domain-containing protein [ANME-2 cluster archaeon]|nr:MAG: leucine-rich repeat domain-containing protein [ANME-2 cluster archaeon]
MNDSGVIPSDKVPQSPTISSITWTRQGSNALKCELIGTSDERTGNGWIHWVLNQAKGVTSAELVLGGTAASDPANDSPYSPTEITPGGVFHFFTPYFDVEGLTAVVNYQGNLGKKANLIISDYCPGVSTTQYTLTVNIVGNGSVEVDDVPYTVSVTVDEGTVLGLEAIADSGWQFDGWTGDLLSSNATESITMNANKTVTATFSLILTTQYTLTVIIVDNGSVEVDDVPYTVPVTVDEGTVLGLEAIADSGWQFDGWTGDLVSSNATESITMNGNKAVTATFSEFTYTSESCFGFDSSTGTITGYDENCGGGDVAIPPTIGGTAVVAIGNQVFYMKSLTSILIPEGMISIGSGAFVANVLHSVTIPNSVTSIGTEAFNSIQLQSLTIGSGLTSIPYNGFGSNDLTSVIIPDNVTSIGQWAFSWNELTSVTIGSGVISIGYNAFMGVQNNITRITIGANVTIDSDANTMGTNLGFKTAYDLGGQLAGIYNYSSGVWAKE